MQMATETHIYGEWPSPIEGADVARKQVGLAFPTLAGPAVWWQESRPSEGGRLAVVSQGPDGISRDLLPMPWNARTRVHEYGGKSYLPLTDGFIFANFADQRLYRAEGGGAPEPLTAAPDDDIADRFADFVLAPGGDDIWCVRERHAGGRITRGIVAVPLDGSAAADPGAVRVLVSGSDFYAYPTPSPDGTRLAWICWDHPRMPWDGTELRVASLDDRGPAGDKSQQQLLMGGDAESVLAPVWRDDRSLYVISDRSGWWNLYLADLLNFPRPLCQPSRCWRRLAVVPEPARRWEDRSYLPRSAHRRTVTTIAGGPAVPMTVIAVDVPAAGPAAQAREVRRSADGLPDAAYLPVPRPARLTGPSGSVVHALIYPPANPSVKGPDSERPPYIVWVHGGPTAHVVPRLDLEKAFFTSRGIGIIDVNYGGSSGYGRAYRERLRGQWGIVDVADVMTAALALAEAGEADGKRLGIRGGSAGGWTALAAVTSGIGLAGLAGPAGGGPGSGGPGRVFAVATSYFGVSELREFAEQTHDFESRYLDGLIGPLPESEALYAARAPVGHVTDATCPVLLLQGLDDPVVPPAQAESIAADLAAHAIPYAYIAFAGESHGFRKAENIVASLEAELSFYGQIMGFIPPGVRPVPLC